MTDTELADATTFHDFFAGCWCTDLFGLAVALNGQADDRNTQQQFIIAQEAAALLRRLDARTIAALCAKGREH